MSSKKRPLLVPQYMNQFSCIGSACEDSCCVGWRVSIDDSSYKKYNRVQDKEMKSLLDKNVTRVRSNSSSENYAKIKMDDKGCCAFLTEDKLCTIQSKLGEEYLSNVCSTYPRVSNRVNGMLEKSATMSCPEAARLALLDPDGIKFDEIEESSEIRNMIGKTMDTHDKRMMNKPQRYFWELRIFTIQVIQNREYMLSERLIILGMFYNKLQDHISNHEIHEIPQLIASYTNMMSGGALRDLLTDIPAQKVIQMEILKELADERIIRGITSNRYLECFIEFLHGIQYTEEASVDEIAERYQEAYDQYYQPFMKEHEYILENYLVNQVYKNMFPFGDYPTVFDEYIMLVIHHALIKMHLIGLAGFHKGMDIELAIKLIQSFAKTVEHNKLYLKQVYDLLHKNGYTSLPYMTIFIKN
ncbi:flagellin lysine-N-methylase [Paenibacillus sp. GP183]|jgi:lysine-N-methylase|uniref:flagellin lysine-N-methylase n=1 Tax=Paenibacillus sp. GP183 TaxID=1882751 RepID=UPI000894D7DC|nr:flagellin lysine-N-methylase [Paenibacillus sp. GP183]SEC34359.1 lysine-N-methylase [Paenibacillus sp. GP183]